MDTQIGIDCSLHSHAKKDRTLKNRKVGNMNHSAHFKVDPRLASLLGENYRSTELAIKELIDNAFDADASKVWITLPRPLTMEPIIIKDNGSGMTDKEVREEYLNIASSRVSRKGERTPSKLRKVKGRKGIGKFAGLMVASVMELHTKSKGIYTKLDIWRENLVKARNDLEQIDLPIQVSACEADESGTEIMLRGINQQFTFPNADRLKRLLILEYGRQHDFQIFVDDQLVDIEDIPGETVEFDITLSSGDTASIRYTISDEPKSLKQSGIAIRVGGKIVGQPQYFGLEEEDKVPMKLLKRTFGEVTADFLESHVTADWGSIIDNSKLMQEIREQLQPRLHTSLMEVYVRETRQAKMRLKKRIDMSLDKLPEHRREQAERTLDQMLKKFYGESDTRIASILSILLDTFQQSDYWMVMQHLEEARLGKAEEMAEAFSAFGLLDISIVLQQSYHRLSCLTDMDRLVFHSDTTLNQVHKALATNLWMLGSQYNLLSTNPELQQVVGMYLDHKFTNGHAYMRPNLLPVQEFNKKFILIDLKAADHPLDLSDRRQAKEYIKDLQVYLPQRNIEVILIGGAISPNLVGVNTTSSVQYKSYKGMISEARVQLNWLIEELKKR